MCWEIKEWFLLCIFLQESSGSNASKASYIREQAEVCLVPTYPRYKDCGNHRARVKDLETDEFGEFKQLAQFYPIHEQYNHASDLLLNILFCFLYPHKDTSATQLL